MRYKHTLNLIQTQSVAITSEMAAFSIYEEEKLTYERHIGSVSQGTATWMLLTLPQACMF